MLQSEYRTITQNTSDTEGKKTHQALAVKEKHYETKWWVYSQGKIPNHNPATARKNWRAKHCQILWSWMGWARGNTKHLFIYYIPHTMSSHKFLNHSEENKNHSLFFFFFPSFYFKIQINGQKKTSSLAIHSLWNWFPVILGLLQVELNSHCANEPSTLGRAVSHSNQQPQKSEWVV